MTRTAKSKAKSGNIKGKPCKVSKKPKIDSNKKCIAKDWAIHTPKQAVIEEVFHRKSERRKIPRDIFLVFEEESNFRRKTRSNKPIKPKFGHLKVEEPIRPKELLRDIKNEPNSYPISSTVSVNTTLPEKNFNKKRKSNSLKGVKNEAILKSESSKAYITRGLKADCTSKSSNAKTLKIPTVETHSYTFDSGNEFVARVNPIFLWAKQDNTRIIEVRCEDYDKRNRIRITKTSNGWRAIPRSDPTSSRVQNFYPTPLMKVKREDHETKTSIRKKIENKNISSCNVLLMPNISNGCVDNGINSKFNEICKVRNPLAIKNLKLKLKNKKSKKIKKSQCEKTLRESDTINTVNVEMIKNIKAPLVSFNKNSTRLQDSPIQISNRPESVINKEITLLNNICTNELFEKIIDHTFENSAGDLETDTNSNFSSLIKLDIPLETKSVYQTDPEKQTFHLCPKTGLFLPNNISNTEYENETNENIYEQNTSEQEQNSDIEKIITYSKIQITEENVESLEAKTKNLKYLLDNADLLQNCDDSANIDADLIDTLVMTSCENDLIQANDITKTVVDQINHKTLHSQNEMIVQLISDVSDPPKCLSFNEAGEIEGLNGELFQSNACTGSFNKEDSHVIITESPTMLHSTTSVEETTPIFQRTRSCENMESIASDMGIKSNILSINEIENTPKDLTSKKREDVRHPSESRSQCAVTSSSDVVKSPRQGLMSPSDSLKNLILDQFITLNTMSTQHQRQHIDEQHITNIYNLKSTHSSNLIDTVVIEDDENVGDVEHVEPLKKRLRINNEVLAQNAGKLPVLDQDPDPLTQLRLLIRHTQWKVPDPILVPKDRLNAVLASPAREIPLLITTRPELKLPDAFAYPEIIQNPNILVISMAQLEAILKNDQIEKQKTSKSLKPNVSPQLPNNQTDVRLSDKTDDLEMPSLKQQLQDASKQPINMFTYPNNSQNLSNKAAVRASVSNSLPGTKQKYVKKSRSDSSSSNMNSTTMAVLNQMLWLPYFNTISQGIAESIKHPIALQKKLPNIELNDITSFEDILKNTTNNETSSKSPLNTARQSFDQQFKENKELSLFEKIVQHQMQSLLHLNKDEKNPSHYITSEPTETSLNNVEKSKPENDSLNLIEQKKQKVFLNNKQTQKSMCENQINNCNNMLPQEKCYNLRSSNAVRSFIESKRYSSSNERQIADNRPRLTCKSLSNLLDPEHSMLTSSSSSTALVQNLSSAFPKCVKEIKRKTTECRTNGSNVESIENFSCNAPVMPPYHRSCSNLNMDSTGVLNKQKPILYENHISTNDVPEITADTNVPLWHPLFGSNTKTAYSSPWQWTTVTATGE